MPHRSNAQALLAAADSDALPPYAVGVVHYRSYEDLEDCLTGIKAQSHPPVAVHVVDGDAAREAHAAMRARHPEVSFEATENAGYAGGANRILARLDARASRAEFVLLLNPDTRLEPGFAEQMLDAMCADASVAIATGKLLRPGGRLIDSAGIRLPPHRRPRDRGSEEPDEGQYDRREYVFGASGAAMMVRRSAIPDLMLDGELFDEDFFAYHEDTDLSWRAWRLGWRVLYVPEARAVHGRGWRRDRRFRVPTDIRRHSFKNHYLQIIKNERMRGLVRGLPVLMLWELLRLGFALVRDPAVLPAYGGAWRLGRRALAKRRILQARIAERGHGVARADAAPLPGARTAALR